MKTKRLILVLVLGMTSWASATITLSPNQTISVGQPFTVTISSSDNSNWMGYVGSETGFGTGVLFGNAISVTKTPNAGSDGFAVPCTGGWAGWWSIGTIDLSEPFEPVLIGIQYVVTGIGEKADDVYYIVFYNGNEEPVTYSKITVIPEPATVLLLLLGVAGIRKIRNK